MIRNLSSEPLLPVSNTPEFELGQRSYRIRLWPAPVFEVRRNGRWRRACGAFDLSRCVILLGRLRGHQRLESVLSREAGREARERFGPQVPSVIGGGGLVDAIFGSVPVQLFDSISEFGAGHRELLEHASRHEGFRDLIQTNPALAVALTTLDRRNSPRGVDPGRVKQAKLCEWLGLPATNSNAKILRKLKPVSCCPESVAGLCRLLASGRHAKLLRHLPALNAAAILFLAEPRCDHLVTRQRVIQLLEFRFPPGDANETHPLWKLVRLAEQTRQLKPLVRALATEFTDLEELDGVLDQSSGLRRTWFRKRKPFPPPPIAMRDGIEPITSYEVLLEETLEQGNCALNLYPQIRRGELYVYRITQPVRATLSLRRARPIGWKIDQLECSHNRPAPQEAWEVVKREVNRVGLAAVMAARGSAGPRN